MLKKNGTSGDLRGSLIDIAFTMVLIIQMKNSFLQPYRIGLPFTHKKSDFGPISVTEGGCTKPIAKVECYISDRFCATL